LAEAVILTSALWFFWVHHNSIPSPGFQSLQNIIVQYEQIWIQLEKVGKNDKPDDPFLIVMLTSGKLSGFNSGFNPGLSDKVGPWSSKEWMRVNEK